MKKIIFEKIKSIMWGLWFITGPGLMSFSGGLLLNGDGGWNLFFGIIFFIIGWILTYKVIWKPSMGVTNE